MGTLDTGAEEERHIVKMLKRCGLEVVDQDNKTSWAFVCCDGLDILGSKCERVHVYTDPASTGARTGHVPLVAYSQIDPW